MITWSTDCRGGGSKMMMGVNGERQEVTGAGTTCIRLVGCNCCNETRVCLHLGGTEVGDGVPVEEEKLDTIWSAFWCQTAYG